MEEKDPVGSIKIAAKYINHIHISENDRGTPGKGNIPWTDTFNAIKNINYNGWLSIEAFGRALPDLAAATRVWRDFFDSDEMGFYSNAEDLLNQLEKLNGNINKINKISRNGKIKYFSIFDNTIVSDYIISKTFNTKSLYKYVWD